ncbi:MAG: hypothetical protein K2Q22_15150 [Cytophagales bacterium]|nr:hypothetical protein [Cytophagales bacterium]
MIQKLSLSFKTTFIVMGVTFMFLSGSLFVKGLIPSMAEFKVPEPVLSSPHYFDAILWVYVHMIVLGLLIFLMGISVTDVTKQRWITMALIAVMCVYGYLDFRSSDSVFGNGLYQGPASIAPAIFCVFLNLMLILLLIRLFNTKSN